MEIRAIPVLIAAIGCAALPLAGASGFDPDNPESIGTFLRSIAPASEAETLALIEALKSDDFVTRQTAAIELGKIAATMRSFLKEQLAKTRDPEVRRGLTRALASRIGSSPSAPLRAAVTAIASKGHRGLAAELVGAIPAADDPTTADDLVAAACLSFEEGDRDELIQRLGKGSTPRQQAAAIRVLNAQGDDLRRWLPPLLAAGSEPVRLAAAESLAATTDPRCIPVLADLAGSQDFHTRWRAIGLLRQIVPAAAALDPLQINQKGLAELRPTPGWQAPRQPAPILLLRDGKELVGWHRARDHHLDDFRPSLREGFVRFNSTASCVWSPPLRFQNYRLRLEWRFPGETFSDSGIMLGKFGNNPLPQQFGGWDHDGRIEIQLRPDHGSGTFLVQKAPLNIRGAAFNGKVSPPFHPANEKPGWNQMELVERDGTLRVFINGILQNEASGYNRGLTSLGLRSEGYPIDFRNVSLEPLPGASLAAHAEAGPEEAE